MSVRGKILVSVAIGIAAVLSSAMARAEDGRPSRQAMQAMGLGSLVVMSDDDAMGVRGMGFMGGGTKSVVRVSGSSFATFNGPNGDGSHSENSYFAEGKHDAKGSNFSFAGVADIWIGGSKKDGKHGGGDYGGMKPGGGDGWMPKGGDTRWVGKGNMPGYPNGGGMNGSGYPGGNGHSGGGYPNIKIHATVFFAGGSSSAWAQ